MSFFEPPPPPPPVPDLPQEPTQGRYVPGVVPMERTLARNDRAAIVLRALYVYPDGVSFQIDTYLRHPEDDEHAFRFPPVGRFSSGGHIMAMTTRTATVDDSEDVDDTDDGEGGSRAMSAAAMQRMLHRFDHHDDFNLGVRFPDGTKVTTLRPYVPDVDWMQPQQDPPTHGLDMGGGSGSDTHYEYSYFVWPLPGDGTVTLVCEWPSFGIDETALDLDTAPIKDAARRARPLWDEDAGLPSHHSIAMSMLRAQRFREAFQADE